MRKSSNGSSHAGFNNRPRQEGAGKWKSNGEKSIQVKHRSPYLRPPLTSFPHPSSPISFRYSFALRAATLERALHPPLVKLLIPTTFCILLFRFSFRCDTSIYLCISSCFVTSISALLEYSSHVFSFFPFFSLLRINQYLFPIQSIILKHPWFNRLI